MRDIDIRLALRRELENIHQSEADALIIDELGVCQGEARIDIAVINGFINGYEIKSERDTLDRLSSQQEIYNKVFDYITIVANGQHIDKIVQKVPQWWGIIRVTECNGCIRFLPIRGAEINQEKDPMCLVQLLWRNETLRILEGLGISRGILGKPRRVMWEKLVHNLPPDDLAFLVRQQLKLRANWRSDLPQESCGDSCLPCATL
jgi:hypothetical protein